MNIFTGVFNLESILGLTIIGVFIILTLRSLMTAKTAKEREQLFVALGVQLLFILIILYAIRHFSPKSKKLIGFLDVLNF